MPCVSAAALVVARRQQSPLTSRTLAAPGRRPIHAWQPLQTCCLARGRQRQALRTGLGEGAVGEHARAARSFAALMAASGCAGVARAASCGIAGLCRPRGLRRSSGERARGTQSVCRCQPLRWSGWHAWWPRHTAQMWRMDMRARRGWRAGSGVPETLLGRLGIWFTLSLRSQTIIQGVVLVRSGQTGLQCSCPGVGCAEVGPARARLCINT